MRISNKLLFIILIGFGLSPIILADTTTPEETTNWTIFLGAGPLYAPAFLGSSDYNLSLIPAVRILYKDLFFASVNGAGMNLINDGHWKIGPIARYRFPRNESDGSNPFKIAGPSSTALQGLGDINGVFELGGFVEYNWQSIRARVEAREGVTDPYGLLATANLDYFNQIGKIRYTFGPHVTWGNSQYNNTYFGINQTQSINSGLPIYSAEASLVNYGVGGNIIIPITRHIITTLFANYDRVAGSPADSPLVTQRGDKNQFMAGLTLSYRFLF